MDDRTLLERAAKAAGYEFLWAVDAAHTVLRNTIGSIVRITPWNPLTDDGDALRLAVKLGIVVDHTSIRCWAFTSGKAIYGVCEEFYGADPYAATRRAIVRAAASMEASRP